MYVDCDGIREDDLSNFLWDLFRVREPSAEDLEKAKDLLSACRLASRFPENGPIVDLANRLLQKTRIRQKASRDWSGLTGVLEEAVKIMADTLEREEEGEPNERERQEELVYKVRKLIEGVGEHVADYGPDNSFGQDLPALLDTLRLHRDLLVASL